MQYKYDFLNIPLELLTFAIRHNKVNQVRLLICMKSLYSGQFKFDDENINLICTSLGCHKKTFHSNLKWLIKHKWVTFYKEYCLIKCFDKIARKIIFISKKSVIFYPDTELKNFRPFIYGALIYYNARLKRRKDNRRKERRPGINKGSSYTRRHPSSNSYNLPNVYLAKVLGISKSCASQYKKLAAKAGYISVTKHYQGININPDNLSLFKKHTDESVSKMIRCIRGEVFIQQPDQITSDLIIKKKRNLTVKQYRHVA